MEKYAIVKQTINNFYGNIAFENFVELNNAGIYTYLLTTPHNLKYNVGHKRINSLHELAEKLR